MSLTTRYFKYFSASLFFLILSKIISLTFRLGSRIIIARFTSVEIYGIFSVIWNEIFLISTISLIGLGQLLTIDLPRFENEDKQKLIITSIFYSIVLGFLSFSVSIIFFLLKSDNTLLYSSFISMVFILFQIFQFIFIGLKDFLGYFINLFSQNFIFMIFIAIFRKKLSLKIIVLIVFISVFGSLILSSIFLFSKHNISVKGIFKQRSNIFSFSKRRIYLFIVDIVNTMILYLLLKLPLIFVNASLSAYVNIAFSVISFVIIPPQMISTSMGPLISKESLSKDRRKMNNILRIGLSLIFVAQGITIIVFSHLGIPFIQLLYGNEYLVGSIFIFFSFLFTTTIDTLNYPYGFYLRNTNNEKIFSIGKIISLFVFIIFGVLFLIFMNQKGIGISIAYFLDIAFLFAFYFYFTVKRNPNHGLLDIRRLLLWMLFILLSVIGSIYVNHLISNLLHISLIMISNIILFVGFIILFKIINVKSLLKEAKILIKQRGNSTNSV